jgi:hypothetical protein
MKIKTFEAACKRQKLDPDKVIPDFSLLPSHHQKAMVAVCKLFILAEEWNAGWKPNWQDNNEWKYYPWFDMEKDKNNPSGFRLNDAVGFYCTDSYVGSRLCFQDRKTAEEFGKQFIDLYRDFMVIEN